MTSRTVLLNPGPVTLTERVRGALTRGDWCHREPEFAALTKSILARLEGVYGQAARGHRAVLLTGSGTCAVEAMVSSFVPRQSKTLVIANGVYGERIAGMVKAHRGRLVFLSLPWLAAIDLETVEQYLRDDASITHVIAVHHETTTGRLNDMERLGVLCAEYGRILLLDAVSSFGAEEIKFAEWNLGALASTANKCLHGAPGTAFVLADERLLEQTPRDEQPLYLDLRNYYSLQSGDGYSPYTPCVPAAFALDEALDEHAEQGGWEARRRRYRAIGSRIRDTLTSLDVDLLLPAEAYSSAMYSYRLPQALAYRSLHDWLKEHGFVIYAGQGRFANDIFRIAHMGDIRDSDEAALEKALTSFLVAERGQGCATLSS
jgi:2-aminoethylphosphonate-pyruvate transaminase